MNDSTNTPPHKLPVQTALGKNTIYNDTYHPQSLCPIPRKEKRIEIGITSNALPFYGYDQWHLYEISWLNPEGKPIAAIGQIDYDCNSPMIIESKSLKLYFNSFNNDKFSSLNDVIQTVKNDLEKAIEAKVNVQIILLNNLQHLPQLAHFTGKCLDDLDINCSHYTVEPDYLTACNKIVTETLYSNLLKSNCPVTNQPDWGSIQVTYQGPKINHAGLLRYIISYRNHNEFHEQCIERIFTDIMHHCKPKELTVHGRYTRRGGIDINPYRSTQQSFSTNINSRLIRQ